MVSKPRGTRDFDASEMDKRRLVQTKMEEIFKQYAYKEIATPTIEHLELFELKSGEAIIDELYSFKDKGDRDLALRPELTAPVMRFYVEKLQMETKPLKYYYFGNCFRYDRPQEGRYREFWQMGCELIGSSHPEAMAELISLAYHSIQNTGLTDIYLRIGNLTFLEEKTRKIIPKAALPDFYPEGQADIFRLIDKNDLDGLKQRLEEFGVTHDDIDTFLGFLNSTSLHDIKQLFKNPTEIQKSDITHFEDMLKFLTKFGVDTSNVIEMKIARGLDYYKGIVFEIEAPRLGAEKQLCGGGSYELVPLLGGTKVPTAGFAIGFDRVLMALEKEGYEYPPSPQMVYIALLDKDLTGEAIAIATNLRRAGFIVEFDLMKRNINKSLKYANKVGASRTVIIGKDEWSKNMVCVKNMQSGEQKEVPIDHIADSLL